MPLFSKNGSIPKPQTDGTDGWVLVPDMPACPDGKQVVWLNWSWVIRDPKPADRDGYQWNWNHADQEWVECALPGQAEPAPELQPLTSEQLSALSTTQISALTTAQI